jgi:hypothetical protein
MRDVLLAVLALCSIPITASANSTRCERGARLPRSFVVTMPNGFRPSETARMLADSARLGQLAGPNGSHPHVSVVDEGRAVEIRTEIFRSPDAWVADHVFAFARNNGLRFHVPQATHAELRELGRVLADRGQTR